MNSSTVFDIANLAGCSPTTVSRFLNQSGYVSKNTAAKIEDAIKKLNYQPNFLARSLRSQINKTIFMAVADIENPFFAQLYKTVQRMATEEGYMLTVYNTGESEEEELRSLELAAQMNVCGIVFFSNNFTESLLCKLKQLKIAAVVNCYDSCDFDAVHGKKNHSAYMATNYLIQQGHTYVGFVGGNSNTAVESSRRNGFLQALQEHGLSCCDESFIEVGFTIEDGKRAGERFLASGKLPTAICCANDLLALGLMKYFNEHGVKIPKDVSIIGIDNIFYDEISYPSLTTVTSDADVFAEKALSMLLERIKGYEGTPRNVEVLHRLIIRKSTRRL